VTIARKPGRRWLRRSLIALAVLAALALGTLALLPRLLDTPAFHAYILQTAAHAVGRPVKFDSIAVSLLPLPNVKLQGLEIADDPRFGTAPLLRVDEVRVGVRVRPLFSGRIELASLALDHARVELVEDAGRWNVSSLAAPTTPPRAPSRTVPGLPDGTAVGSVMVSRVRLTDAAVHVRRRGLKNGELGLDKINVTVSGVGSSDLTIQGDARIEPGGLNLRDMRVTVGLRAAEMPIKGSVSLEGDDIAPLASAFLFASPAVSGPVKGKLEVSGTAARPGATGELDLSRATISQDRPQCPAPKRRQLALQDVRVPVLLKPSFFESAPLQAQVGKGTVALRVTAGLGEPSPLLTLGDIKIAKLELLPVLQGYLCQSFAVSGPLDLGGELAMRTADMWRTMNGTGRFTVGSGRLAGEGALALVRQVLQAGSMIDRALQGDFSGPGKTALEFQAITGTYRITNGLARTDDLVYQSKDLKMTAAGTYGLADGRADMAVVITQSGGQFRAQVTGSGGSFRVVPTGVNVKDPAAVKKLLDRLLR
jgi:AsmA protein